MLVTERLKAARKEAGYTQGDVAGMLGVDRSTYAYYELGTTNPSLENLTKLASIFNVDIPWLLGSDRPKNAFCAPDDMFSLNRAVKEKRVGDLSPDERRIVGLFRIAKKSGREQELAAALKEIAGKIL